jgi:hypothetical protein
MDSHRAPNRPTWRAAPRRATAAAGVIIAAIGAAAITGCSGNPAPATGSSPAATVPVLGRLTGVFARGEGFGQVKPAKIFNGGDPTGLVTRLIWSSWGGRRAVGTGLGDYVGQGQSVASGSQKQVTVVAFNLGTCHGTRMYRAVEWYFPGEGQAFDPTRYENICAGAYVPNP